MKKESSASLKYVVKGYTTGVFEKTPVYFKHFGVLDHINVDENYSKSYEWAIGRGLPTEKDQLKFCIEEGLWTEKEEESLNKVTEAIRFNKEALAKVMFGQQKRDIKKQLENAESQRISLFSKKELALGLTAEKVANKHANELFVFLSAYNDEGLTSPKFTESEFTEVDNQTINRLIVEFNKSAELVNSDSLKNIAIDPFFVSIYRLMKNAKDFFKCDSLLDLTFVQVELLTYASIYTKIILENQVPDNIRDNAEEILQWYNSKNNTQEAVDKMRDKGGATAIVGASKEELKSMGMNDGIDLQKEIRKGKTSPEDMIRLLKG